MEAILERFEREWGEPVGIEIWSPSMAGDERYKQWRATYLRLAASPGAAIGVMRMNMEIDVRHVLPAIRVPTLILHRTGHEHRQGFGGRLRYSVPGSGQPQPEGNSGRMAFVRRRAELATRRS